MRSDLSTGFNLGSALDTASQAVFERHVKFIRLLIGCLNLAITIFKSDFGHTTLKRMSALTNARIYILLSSNENGFRVSLAIKRISSI